MALRGPLSTRNQQICANLCAFTERRPPFSYLQLLEMPARFFLSGKRFSTGILASKTRLKKPTIISSQLCSPHVTSFVGSAFSGFAAELSKCAVQSIFVPLGRAMGSSRLYQFCQCQS